jgi:hypothetical protein
MTSIVGPQPDKDDFDTAAYNDAMRHLNIPSYPAMKALPISTANSPNYSSPSALPSPARQHIGQSPWRTFEQDPSRPVTSPERDLEDANMHVHIAQSMSRLDVKDQQWRFHGKASPHHLWMKLDEIRGVGCDEQAAFLDTVKQNRRKEYWQIPEWESALAREGLRQLDYAIWPEKDLAAKLIDAYFDQVNLHTPLLNRFIFQRQFEAENYRSSHEFAKVCLLVFANGARYVNDARVYWPMEHDGREGKPSTRYSEGWIYLREVIRMGRSLMQSPNLLDFQMQVLLCLFLHGSAVPHLTWIISGLGIRAAQEIGIHVRSILLHADPTERALYNRAFWCLYHIDRLNCAAIGRSVAIQDTDFDADYPLMVDDEYWDTGDPSRNFIQPPEAGESRISAFTHTLKLDHIIGAALRTIYSLNILPEHRADPASRRPIVVELDSALNSWADAVPEALRWDGNIPDQRLFDQSAGLYAYYYYCQILVHRPFIPTPKHSQTIGLPSLAICNNAARSIANILDACLRRGQRNGLQPGHTLAFHFLVPAWIATIILVISLYANKYQQPVAKERGIRDIKVCISACREIETMWRQAGKFTDFLVVILGDLEKTMASPIDTTTTQGVKRTYADSNELSSNWQTRPDLQNITHLDAPAPVDTLYAAQNAAPIDPMLSDVNDQSTLNMTEPTYNTFEELTGFEVPAVDDGMDEFWAQLLGGYA